MEQDQYFKHVSIGGTFGAAVSSEGMVWTWGMNTNGELGIGDNEPRLYPVVVHSITHKNVEMVSCGGSFALSTGTVVHDSQGMGGATEQDTGSIHSSAKTVPPHISENFKIQIPAEKYQKKKNINRDRSFGENIGNTSAVN